MGHHLRTTPATTYPEGGYLRPDEHGLAILPNPSPWVYGLYLPLSADILVGAEWIVAKFGPTGFSFGLGLLNAAGDAFVTRVEAPGGKRSVEIWLPIESADSVSALVLHNWDPPLDAEVVLRQLSLVADVDKVIP